MTGRRAALGTVPCRILRQYDAPQEDEARRIIERRFGLFFEAGGHGQMTAHYPRPPILDKIPRDQHAVIEASAGTGKTFTIEHMVIELLLRKRNSADQ